MNNSSNSALQIKIKRILKISCAVMISLVMLSILVAAALSEREDPPFAQDSSASGTVTEPPPDTFFEEDPLLYLEGDFPTAIGIYDEIYGEAIDAVIPDGELRIAATDLSKNPSADKMYIKNNTDYKIDYKEHLSADKLSIPTVFPVSPDSTEPLVLIYHTHGTEGYASEDAVSYRKKDLPRSTDITKNVVAVGRVIADTLNACGVPTIHCETMFDQKSYINSYTYSRTAVAEYLEQYPSIKYVFDVHRDALASDTTVYKVLTYDESTPVAQIMLVVGTDSAGAVHPNWQNNLSLAVDTQYLLTKRLENIVRPICIKNASYNQQLSSGAMLIEVGTCVNTLAEAKASAEILGKSLAALIAAKSSHSADGM